MKGTPIGGSLELIGAAGAVEADVVVDEACVPNRPAWFRPTTRPVIAVMKAVIAVSIPGNVAHHDCFFDELTAILLPWRSLDLHDARSNANGRDSARVDDRAATKDDIGAVDLGRVVGRADDCELTVRGEVLPEQRRHGCAAGRPPDPKTATTLSH